MMIGRKTALEAGKKLNAAAAVGVVPHGLSEAVRVANEVMFQYFLIPPRNPRGVLPRGAGFGWRSGAGYF